MNTLYKEKFNGLAKNADSIQVLILGNSHANYGVDPHQFTYYSYNIANIAQSIYFDKYITASALTQLKNLRYALISVDYHSLYFSSQDIRDVWSYYAHGIKYKDKDYTLENLSPFLFGYTPKVSTALIKRNLTYAIKYRKKTCLDFDVEYGVNIFDSIDKGFLAYTGRSPYFKEDDLIRRSDEFTQLILKSNEKPEVYKDLEDLIQLLKANKVTPILITIPTYTAYNKILDKNIVKENLKDVQALTAKYRIEYWDYMDTDLFTIGDFFNCDHLNKEGAAKFSRLLNQRLMQKEKRVDSIPASYFVSELN